MSPCSNLNSQPRMRCPSWRELIMLRGPASWGSELDGSFVGTRGHPMNWWLFSEKEAHFESGSQPGGPPNLEGVNGNGKQLLPRLLPEDTDGPQYPPEVVLGTLKNRALVLASKNKLTSQLWPMTLGSSFLRPPLSPAWSKTRNTHG